MALRDQPYLPLYVQDFLTDEKLNECSAESTGVYIRLMCILHKSQDYGSILLKQKDKQTASKISDFALKLVRQMPYDATTIERSLTELLDEGVLAIESDTLFQKRMVRDGKLSDIRALAAKSKKGTRQNSEVCSDFANDFATAKSAANSENENEIECEDEDVNESVGDVEKGTTRARKKAQKEKVFLEDDKAYKAAAYLAACICKRLPSQKPADERRLQSWAAAFDKCHRIDGQSWEDIARVLKFSQEDPFWQQNILSAAKFREKYVQLLAKMKSTAEGRRPSASAKAMSDLQQIHEMFSEEDG